MVETDPKFPPLAAEFRKAVLGSIVTPLARSEVLDDDLDLGSQEFNDAIYTIAFLVLAQLEEGRGFETDGQRFHSHLVFTPVKEHPTETSHLITQSGRTLLHGGLEVEEVNYAIEDYIASQNE